MLIMGAVAYDQKVVTIWDGFQQYFRSHGLAFDYVLYSNYERQVEAHLLGHVHVAWNSPLAWLQTERAARGSAAARKPSACATPTATSRSIVLVRSRRRHRDESPISRGRLWRRRARLPAGHADPVELSGRSGTRAAPRLRGAACSTLSSESTAITSAASATRFARCFAARPTRRALSTRTIWPSRERGPFRAESTQRLAQTPPYDHCNFTVLDGAPRGADRAVPRAAPGHVVQRCRGSPAARSRRA